MKVADVVKYVLANRRNKVCKGWSPYQITQDIGAALQHNTFAYTVDDCGHLTGVVWGVPDYKKRILYISIILVTSKESFSVLMKYFLKVYDGWTLSAHRRDRFVVYNTVKLQKHYGQ